MVDRTAGAGKSNYNAVQLTMTVSPRRPKATCHASWKRYASGWGDFEALIPYWHIEVSAAPTSPLEALKLLQVGLGEAIARLEE